jgi:hypothetical protein
MLAVTTTGRNVHAAAVTADALCTLQLQPHNMRSVCSVRLWTDCNILQKKRTFDWLAAANYTVRVWQTQSHTM